MRTAAWKVCYVLKISAVFQSWKSLKNECSPLYLTQLQDNLHSEISEQGGKRESPLIPLHFHPSFKTAFSWSCLNWESSLPSPVQHFPATSWEERRSNLQLVIIACKCGLCLKRCGWQEDKLQMYKVFTKYLANAMSRSIAGSTSCVAV